MDKFPEHGPAQTELDEARDLVDEENYPQAAHHVKNAQRDVNQYAVVDYGVWREQFDALVEKFIDTIAWRDQNPSEGAISWSKANAYETDPQPLFDILDELEKTLGEMGRLAKEFRERYAATGSPQNTATGLSRPEDLGMTEEDVPEDLQLTCVRCRRGVTQMGSVYFLLENHPGDRLLCGECLFEMDVVAHEEVDDLEINLEHEAE